MNSCGLLDRALELCGTGSESGQQHWTCVEQVQRVDNSTGLACKKFMVQISQRSLVVVSKTSSINFSPALERYCSLQITLHPPLYKFAPSAFITKAPKWNLCWRVIVAHSIYTDMKSLVGLLLKSKTYRKYYSIWGSHNLSTFNVAVHLKC